MENNYVLPFEISKERIGKFFSDDKLSALFDSTLVVSEMNEYLENYFSKLKAEAGINLVEWTEELQSRVYEKIKDLIKANIMIDILEKIFDEYLYEGFFPCEVQLRACQLMVPKKFEEYLEPLQKKTAMIDMLVLCK